MADVWDVAGGTSMDRVVKEALVADVQAPKQAARLTMGPRGEC